MKVSAALDEDKSLVPVISFPEAPTASSGIHKPSQGHTHTPTCRNPYSPTHTIINSETVRHGGICFQSHHSGGRG